MAHPLVGWANVSNFVLLIAGSLTQTCFWRAEGGTSHPELLSLGI